jgi:SAM-dependent methyltransferase
MDYVDLSVVLRGWTRHRSGCRRRSTNPSTPSVPHSWRPRHGPADRKPCRTRCRDRRRDGPERVCRDRLRAHAPLDNALIVQGNILEPPFEPGCFDLVNCDGVLHHTPDPRRGFGRLVRLLGPRGRVHVWMYGQGRSPFRTVRDTLRVADRLPPAVLAGLPYVFGAITWIWYLIARSDLPRRDRREISFRYLDNLIAPIQHRHTAEEVRGWFEAVALAEVTRNSDGTYLLPRRPAQPGGVSPERRSMSRTDSRVSSSPGAAAGQPAPARTGAPRVFPWPPCVRGRRGASSGPGGMERVAAQLEKVVLRAHLVRRSGCLYQHAQHLPRRGSKHLRVPCGVVVLALCLAAILDTVERCLAAKGF